MVATHVREIWIHTTRYAGAMDAYATSGFANAMALFDDVLPAATTFTAQAVAAAATRVKLPVGSLADGSGIDFPATGSELGENQAAASVIWEWVAPGKGGYFDSTVFHIGA